MTSCKESRVIKKIRRKAMLGTCGVVENSNLSLIIVENI
jgi:hypothetical protein